MSPSHIQIAALATASYSGNPKTEVAADAAALSGSQSRHTFGGLWRVLFNAAVAAAILLGILGSAHQAAAQWTPVGDGEGYMAATLGASSSFTAPTFDANSAVLPGVTIEAWVKLDPNADAGIVQLETAFGGVMALYAVWDGGAGDFQLFYYNDNGSVPVDFASGTRINPGEWTHVAGTYDNAAATVWVNGVGTSDSSWVGDFGPGQKLFNNNTWGAANPNGTPLGLRGETTGLRVWAADRTPTVANSKVNLDLSGAGATLLGNFQAGTNGDTTPLVGSPVGGTLIEVGANVGFVKNGPGDVSVTANDFFADTIAAGTLEIGGSAGQLVSPISVASGGTLSFNRNNDFDHSFAISGAGGVTKLGTGTTTLSAANSYTGDTSINAGGLNLTGSLASDVIVGAAGTLLGSGSSTGILTGDGSVDPGNSQGILAFASLDASAGMTFNFEFTAADPDYSDATASVNDVLRLTDGTPFITPLASNSTVNIYLNVDSFSPADEFRGGFFTDSTGDFRSQIADATFNYFLKDASGSEVYNGVNYSNVTSTNEWVLMTVPASADFAGGTVNGRVLQVVPEPSSFALAGCAIAGLAAAGYRRRQKAIAGAATEAATIAV